MLGVQENRLRLTHCKPASSVMILFWNPKFDLIQQLDVFCSSMLFFFTLEGPSQALLYLIILSDPFFLGHDFEVYFYSG